MLTEDKSPLLIFGTPLGGWHPLAGLIVKAQGLEEVDRYDNWHRDLFKINASEFEVGRSMIGRPKLEIPEQLKAQVEKLTDPGLVKPRMVGASVFGCWTADYWFKALPSAKGLIYYDPPSRMISNRLLADPSASVEVLMSIWIAAAREIASTVRRYRERCYLLDATECMKSEENYRQWMEQRMGIILGRGEPARDSLREDAALKLLTEVLCQGHRSITDLFQELEASTQPIDAEWVPSDPREMAESAATAVREVLSLRQKSDDMTAAVYEKENAIALLENRVEHHKAQEQRKEREIQSLHEILFTEIHHAFEESECYFQEWKKAETSRTELALKVDSVTRGRLREDSDHRHINYTFHDANLFDRYWPVLHVRLVQHLGHAGIAFLATKDTEQKLFARWKPSGNELNVKYALFVPTDASARAALIHATTSDLALITDSVFLIQSDLRVHGLPENSRTSWIHVVDRLQAELDDLPEKLHYESVASDVTALGNDAHSFTFDIVLASFRDRIYSRLKLVWSPSPKGGRLTIRLQDNDPPPLSYWPQTGDGKFVDALDFAYSTRTFSRRKNNPLFRKLTGRDKALLQAILSEIPNLLVHAYHQHPANGVISKHLAKYAVFPLQKGNAATRIASPMGFFV